VSYKVVIASEFAKEAKRIAKKHIGIKSDIAKLVSDLATRPTMGPAGSSVPLESKQM